MIRTITGVPGSGKTTYAVNYLIKNYYEYDSFYDTFDVRTGRSVLVISNIEGLRIEHLDLDKCISEYKNFWSYENFQKIREVYRIKNIVLIVDEAQKYFDYKSVTKEMLYLFQYHRHLGIDIFLITQTQRAMDRRIVELSENIIEAIPRSKQVIGFAYNIYDIKGNKIAFQKTNIDKNDFLLLKVLRWTR